MGARVTRLSKLAFPIIVSQLIMQLMAFTDIWMMSKLGVASLAAGGLAISVYSFIFIVGKSIVLPTANLLSIAFGQINASNHDDGEVHAIVCAALLTAALLFVAVLPIFYFAPQLLGMFGQQPEIITQSLYYLDGVKWSLLPMLLLIVFQCVPIAHGDSRSVLMSSSLLVFANILLSYTLTFEFEMGIAGLAWGTTIAAALTFVFYSRWVLKSAVARYFTSWSVAFKGVKVHLEQLRKMGFSSATSTMTECSLLSGAALMAGTLGAVYLASHQIALQVLIFSWNVAYGFSQATSMMIGQQFGSKGCVVQMKQTAMTGLALVTVVTFAIGLSFLIFPELLNAIFLSGAEASTGVMADILPGVMMVAACCFVVDAWQLVALNILRGLKVVLLPAVITFVGYCLIGLPVAFWLKSSLMLNGIWIGIGVGLAVTGILLVFVVRKSFADLAKQQNNPVEPKLYASDTSQC